MIHTRLIASVILIVSLCFISHADESFDLLLEGKIGKASVVMELTVNGTEVSGNYYYKRFKKSIPLEGTFIDASSIELVYEHWDTKETFRIKEIGKGNEIVYSGTWKNEEHATPLPVTLTVLDPLKIVLRNTLILKNKVSTYDYSRLADIQIIQDSVQTLNPECSLVWLRDTLSGFSFFRIKPNMALKGIDSINKNMNDLQISNILSYLDCLGEYTSEISSLYMRGHVFSFALSGSYDCGGAHPDFGTTGYTYNMETGKTMELTDFLYFGKTKADYPPKEDYKFGSEVVGPGIVKLLTTLYPVDMKKPAKDDEGDCDYSDTDSWNYPAWYLTADGLYLYPYFYRAARNCDGAEFSYIPYKVLQKYKNPAVIVPMKY